MKCIFLSIAFLLKVVCFAQSKVVEYKIEINPPSNEMPDFYLQEIKDLKTIEKFVTFKLVFDNHKMMFFGEKNVEIPDERFEDLLRISNVEGKFYKSIYSNVLFRDSFEFDVKIWVTSKSKIKTASVIVNEFKTILGYRCQKAIANQYVDDGDGNFNKSSDLILWFCPDLKFSCGPLGYEMKEGLILEAKQRLVTFTATKINLNAINFDLV